MTLRLREYESSKQQKPLCICNFVHVFSKTTRFRHMVLLTMTPAIVAVVNLFLDGEEGYTSNLDEPPLVDAYVGKPISHKQLIDIATYLKKNVETIRQKSKNGDKIPVHLAELLRGSSIHIPESKPKPEPTSEYKALMARL